MALRHEAEFKNDNHETFYLAFYDSEYAGAEPISDLIIAGSGFTLEWDGRAENTHQPIISSACTIPIVSNDSDSENFLDAILGGQEGQFRVEIHEGPEASRRLFWSGVLFCDLTIKDEMPSLMNLQATDDLGLLNEILYKQTESAEYTDTTHLVNVFCRILSKCRHLDAWGATQNFLIVADSVQHDDMTGEPYTTKIIINHQKLRNVDDSGQPRFHTCREVLVNMLQNLSARMFQADGFFWVMPLAHIAAGSCNAFAYYKDGSNGNLTDRPDYSAGYSGTANKLAIAHSLTASNIQKLGGWEFGQLPPLRSVEYLHNYNGSAPDWMGVGPSNGTNIGDGYSFANGSPILESGDIVSLTFAYHFSFNGWGASSGSRGRRLKFSFSYRHGTAIYAGRDADPATDSLGNVITATYGTSGTNVECFATNYQAPFYSSDVHNKVESFTGVFDRYTGADLQGTFTITFPELGSDANAGTEVGFWNVEVLDEDGNVDGTAPSSFAVEGLSDIYQMRGAATFDGDVIRYARINDDANSRENLELEPAILGDKVGNSNPNQSVWLINASGTFTKSTPNWSNANHPTASTAIHDLSCLDIISARFDPLETCTGDLEAVYYVSPLFRLENLGESAGYYSPLRLTYKSNKGCFSGEFCLLSFSTDDNSTSDDNGGTPFALSGISTAGPRSARQIMQGTSYALAREAENLQQEATALQYISAEVPQVANSKIAATNLGGLADVNVAGLSTNDLLKYDGTQWRPAASSGGGASALDDLTDVDAGSASDGQVLKYNATASEWQASADQGATAFADLDDVNPSLTNSPGDLLVWTTVNGGQWNSTSASLAIGGQIDLGDLNNVSQGSGTAGNILFDAGNSSLGPFFLSVNPATWAGLYLPLGDLSNVSGSTPSTGDVLTWSGTAWEPTAPSGGSASSFSYHILNSSFFAFDGNGDYIPVGGTLSETTSSNYYTIWSAPCAGEVVKATCLVQATTAGNTTLEIRGYPSTTAIDSDTIAITGGYATNTFNFTSATFAAGDRLRFRFDPTGRPSGVQLSILIKLTH